MVFDSEGCEVTSRAYVKGKLPALDADSYTAVACMLGPIGVDSVNASNEVVSSRVCVGV